MRTRRLVVTLQTHKTVISIQSISKRFGATQALDKVSFDINGGEVLALLGANGAGKSTIIKILAGIYSLDSGAIVTPTGESLDSIRFAAPEMKP